MWCHKTQPITFITTSSQVTQAQCTEHEYNCFRITIDKSVMALRSCLFFGVYIFAYVYVYVCIAVSHASSAYVYSKACVPIRIHVFDCIRRKCEVHPILLCHPHIACGHFRHFTSKGVFLIYWLYHYISSGIVFINDASWSTWCYFINCIYCILLYILCFIPWTGQELTSIKMIYIYTYVTIFACVHTYRYAQHILDTFIKG